MQHSQWAGSGKAIALHGAHGLSRPDRPALHHAEQRTTLSAAPSACHLATFNSTAHRSTSLDRSSMKRPSLVPDTQPSHRHPITRKCSAGYSPALAHLNPTTRATNKPLNSARQSLHSLHLRYAFMPLRRKALFSGKEQPTGAAHSASLRLRNQLDHPAPTHARKGSHSPQVAEEQPCWLSFRLCS